MSSRPQQRRANQMTGPDSGQAGRVDGIRAVEFSAYSGPLPPPEILRQFEEVLPGSAERIFTQFEAQSAHRRSLEATVVSSGAFSQKLGTISAALIGLMGVGGGIWLAHGGKSLEGLSTSFTTLAVLVGTYLYQRHKQDAERARKDRTTGIQTREP